MAIRVYQVAVQVLGTAPSGTEVIRSVTQSLSLTQEAVYGEIFLTAEDDLGLTQSVLEVLEISDRIPVAQELGLVQSATVEGFRGVSQDLDLQQEASYIGPVPLVVSQSLNLNQQAQGTISGLPWTGFHVGHWLYLSSAAGSPIDKTVAQAISFVDFGTPWNAQHDLDLSQDISAGRGFTGSNDLDLESTAELDADYNQGPNQSLGVSQSAAYYIESRCGRYERNSFHGTGGTNPASPALKYKSKLLLQSGTDVEDFVQLRNPETDNRRRVAYQRVNRELFDGTIDVYTDDEWVDELDQLYTIVATKADDLEDLLDFVLRHLGEQIIVKDWEGVSWSSIILNSSEVFTEDGEGYWTLELQLRSSRLDGEALPHALDLASTATGVVDRPEGESQALALDSEATYVVTP